MKLKRFINIILVAVIIILIGVTNYFIFIRKSEPVIEKNPSTQIPTSTFAQIENSASSTPILKNETEDWKTYKNEKYRFEFQYPSDFNFVEIKDDEVLLLRFENFPSDYYECEMSCPPKRLGHVSFLLEINGVLSKQYKLIHSSFPYISNTEKDIYATMILSNNIIVIKHISYEFEKSSDYIATQFIVVINNEPFAYFSNSTGVEFDSKQTQEAEANIIEKIVATFKFIEPAKSFPTQQECEQATGKQCGFKTCDFIPKGKTYEEVCGKNFQKGWVPLEN